MENLDLSSSKKQSKVFDVEVGNLFNLKEVCFPGGYTEIANDARGCMRDSKLKSFEQRKRIQRNVADLKPGVDKFFFCPFCIGEKGEWRSVGHRRHGQIAHREKHQ
jgi:hypothetical protein